MKKMQYAIIFIIVLVLLVFVGCIRFSNELPGMQSDPDDTSLQEAETIIDAQQAEEEEALVGEMIDNMRSAVDEEGQTVFSEEEISSAEVSMRAEIASAAAAVNQTPTNAAQPTTVAPQTPATQATQPSTPSTSQPAATTPSQPAQQTPTGPTEFDILRSGSFYCIGSMNDGAETTPLELAVTPTSVYMVTKFESVDIGLLVSDGTTYMIYPDERVYLKVSSLILKMMDMDPDEMLSASDLGFSEMEPLNKASGIENGTFRGQSCTIYSFNKSDGGKQLVYMDGSRLLAMEAYDSAGKLSSGTYVTSITGNVPADKINPPTDYKEVGLTKFMTLLAGVM